MKKNIAFILLLLLYTFACDGQAPQWDWAKSAGGNCNDGMVVNRNVMQTDGMGNVYEIINSNSSSITFGSYTFTDPYAPSNYICCFVKYDTGGNVVWATQFPLVPGGGTPVPYMPISMFTNAGGYSYLMFRFQDSIRLGSLSLVDTSFGISPSNPWAGYCLAIYDPNGNVVSLHAYKSINSYWLNMMPFNGNQIVALGQSGGDTLNGHVASYGSFIAVMDSTGNVIKTQSIARDTGIYGFPLNINSVAAGNESIYITLGYPVNVVFYPSIPVPYTAPYAGQNLVIKLDTALNYQWVKTCNFNPGISADQHDNVYLNTYKFSTIPEDTVIIDTTKVTIPFRVPLGHYEYLVLAKINGSGTLQWVDTFLNFPQYSAAIAGVCADRLDNIYAYGTFATVLNVNPYTLIGGSAFVAKMSAAGSVLWAQTAQGGLQVGGIAEDGHGNVYVNGLFTYATVANTFFGADTLICHAPISGDPNATDIYTARLGNCNMPTPIVTASSALTWCGTDSVMLSAPVAKHYLWSTGDTTAAIIVYNTGQYSVMISDTFGCYAGSATVSVFAYLQPSLSVSVANNVHCYDSSDGSITLLPTAGTSPYTYAATPFIANYNMVAAGSYTITSTDYNGCLATSTVTITQPLSSLTTHTDSVASTIAGGNGIAIVAASGGTPGYSYSWNTVPLQNTDSATGLMPGWYQVTVTDANGCSKTDSVFVSNGSTTGIGSTQTNGISARVYPNPSANGNVTIELMNTTQQGILILYNTYGQSVWTQSVSAGKNECHFLLPGGLYSMKITLAGYQQNIKLVITK